MGPTSPPLTGTVLTLKPFTLRRSTPQPQSCSPTVAMASPKLTTADGQNTGSGLSGQYDASPHSDSPEIQEDEPSVNDVADDQGPKPQPLQKRRRVTRACDECRRKKIKCDGKQPCTHCTVYSYGKLPWSSSHGSLRRSMLTSSVEWYFHSAAPAHPQLLTAL